MRQKKIPVGDVYAKSTEHGLQLLSRITGTPLEDCEVFIEHKSFPDCGELVRLLGSIDTGTERKPDLIPVFVRAIPSDAKILKHKLNVEVRNTTSSS